MTQPTYKLKPVYQMFNGSQYKLYAVTESESGAKLFIKKHGSKFKGIKLTKAPDNPEEWIVWTKL
jgi:hypothetical protein